MYSLNFALAILLSLCRASVEDAPQLITQVLPGNYNHSYSIAVNRSIEYIYVFTNNDMSMTHPPRISFQCDNANRSFPVLVVVRQQKGVLSWQLPLIVETKTGVYGYNRTARTLCPDNNYYSPHPNAEQSLNSEIIVSISTASNFNMTVNLNVTLVPDFFIRSSQMINMSVSPAEPRYYGYKFPDSGPSTVLLRVDSDDEICVTISIQNMSCPVFDLEHNVQFEGYWQTMNKRGGITIAKSAFPNGFYLVFVVKGDDLDCSGDYQTVSDRRIKTLRFSLSPGISINNYLIAVFAALAVLAAFYLICIAIALGYYIRNRRSCLVIASPTFSTIASSSHMEQSLPGHDRSLPEHADGSSIQDGPPLGCSTRSPSVRSLASMLSDSSLDETDIDMLLDADKEKDVFRTKTHLRIRDLARKHPRILQKKSQLYLWNLLTVGMFYALPVVQLVLTYQNVVNQSGNQDLCFYNFLCSHPLGFVSDFNHVFSNVGYVLLGLLFIGLTYRRDLMHRGAGADHDKHYGIPQHYGLFYTMGAALIMEGIMSGCYHVCPNHSNFQFDTSFMYVMAMVSMVKIYQTRHPDINASAYATYGVLAAVIFVGMWGVLDGSLKFWIAFTIAHLITCLVLTAQIYYMGRWKLDRGVFARVFCSLFHDFRASPVSCFKPQYPSRMVLLLLGNLCNWGLAAYGLRFHQDDFATHLLFIFMSNLLLYYHFYIVMKMLSGERILTQPLIFILLSSLTWAGSLYFFFNKSISWALTPAGSRGFNRPCAVLDFYDNHDIWHFLSAASMFFSFLVLLTLDDDLTLVHRSKIKVF